MEDYTFDLRLDSEDDKIHKNNVKEGRNDSFLKNKKAKQKTNKQKKTTRNVALLCCIEEQIENEQTKTTWSDFGHPIVLTLGAGIIKERYSPHRKRLHDLCSPPSVIRVFEGSSVRSLF